MNAVVEVALKTLNALDQCQQNLLFKRNLMYALSPKLFYKPVFRRCVDESGIGRYRTDASALLEIFGKLDEVYCHEQICFLVDG